MDFPRKVSASSGRTCHPDRAKRSGAAVSFCPSDLKAPHTKSPPSNLSSRLPRRAVGPKRSVEEGSAVYVNGKTEPGGDSPTAHSLSPKVKLQIPPLRCALRSGCWPNSACVEGDGQSQPTAGFVLLYFELALDAASQIAASLRGCCQNCVDLCVWIEFPGGVLRASDTPTVALRRGRMRSA